MFVFSIRCANEPFENRYYINSEQYGWNRKQNQMWNSKKILIIISHFVKIMQYYKINVNHEISCIYIYISFLIYFRLGECFKKSPRSAK
jgi:hypothetical protein